MSLSSPMSMFSANVLLINGILPSKKCIIFYDPFADLPSYDNYQNDYKFVLHCFKGHTGTSLESVEAELMQSSFCKALLGTIHYKKYTIMFEENALEIHDDVKAELVFTTIGQQSG
jgi:hypothetical protein